MRAPRGIPVILLAGVVGLTLVVGCSPMADEPRRTRPGSGYVFAWPFLDASGLRPRGGTTRGPEVRLATGTSSAWEALRSAGPSDFERDRAAILAMAGDYRTSFDFLETVVFDPPHEPSAPYRSWGTERVYVIEDRGTSIRLQHILVAFIVDDEGVKKGPFVQKHWRQDWQYEPETVSEFAGNRTWRRRLVPPGERAGRWRQTVYQVDDTPRYASVGAWMHAATFSAWEGNTTWRPLPRREHSVRKDYQVLKARNRQTILPHGWVHEQENLKLVLGEDGGAHAGGHYRAREIGVNRYERIEGFPFEAADDYWRATAPFWGAVRDAFDRLLDESPEIRVAKRCGDTPVFMRLFLFAEGMREEPPPAMDEIDAFVGETLDCIVTAGPAASVAP